jgi:hypothetical protein
MGRKVLGSVAVTLAFSAAFLSGSAARGQEATAPADSVELPSPSPPPAPQPVPAPVAEPAPALDPPPPVAAPQRPHFLGGRGERADLGPRAAAGPTARTAHQEFVARASPWVDLSLGSFYLEDRVGNFLNFGVQVGGYLFEHVRVSARLLAPTEEVRDQSSNFSSFSGDGLTFFSTTQAPSRSMSVLYGASVGFVLSNDRSFVFGPNIGFVRTDVEDYGTAVVVGLPFEWTTGRRLRVGFELSIGRASGGTALSRCTASSGATTASCGLISREREAGTAVMLSYNMGWALGRL